MCGRVAHLQTAATLQTRTRAHRFVGADKYRVRVWWTDGLVVCSVLTVAAPQTSYNAGPTRYMPVLVADATTKQRELRSMRWGLIPGWTKPTTDVLSHKQSINTINARDDAVLGDGASLWHAFKNRKRCVVVADGFFEWKIVGKERHPHYIHLPDKDRLFTFAGLYDVWKDANGDLVYSCSIITTTSEGSQMKFLHDRMPVMLTTEEDIDRWLDADVEFDAVSGMLRPCTDPLVVEQVSTFVNKIGNDAPECIVPLAVSGLTNAKTRPITSFFAPKSSDSSSSSPSTSTPISPDKHKLDNGTASEMNKPEKRARVSTLS